MTNFKQLDSGTYEQDSGIEGPTLTIIGGVHGSETCGVEVLNFLIENIQIKIGKILLIYGNMEGIVQGKRQVDQNLNRMFQDENIYSEAEKESYEYKRAQEIKLYLDESDALLDLHSSPTEGSPAFIITEDNAREIVQNFPFKNVSSGFDNVEPGGTDYYMNTIGKIGICVENGNHNAPEARDNAMISTLEFLKYYRVLDTENIEKIQQEISQKRELEEKQYFRAIRAYITETISFRVVKEFRDFEKIEKGQLIGYDGEKSVYAENTGRILFAYNRDKIGVEGFVEIIEKQ